MSSKQPARYVLTADGLQIFGSDRYFNRVLYGGHGRDHLKQRFFTFAGDRPLFMGASTDYGRNTWCHQAKNGVLMSGLALTPGVMLPSAGDKYSIWFHDSSDVLTTWKHGYMEYRLSRVSSKFPSVSISIQAYPIIESDGFLINYDITSDQRVYFCTGFGGLTEFFGRFEYQRAPRRDFSLEDCKDNRVEIGDNMARIHGPNQTEMLIGCDFNADFVADNAAAMLEMYPSQFLKNHEGEKQVVKISHVIEAGEQFSGRIAVLQNSDAQELQRWLQPGAANRIKSQIRRKHADISFVTPDEELDRLPPDLTTALDASWHGDTFYHGAQGYHAPFLGWRGWYGPSLLGWKKRVSRAIRSHFATIHRSQGPEKVWWDGSDRPDLDHEGTQYHRLQNSSGYLSALLHIDDIYNMQEVAVDMCLHYLNMSADWSLAEEIFGHLEEILAWEERILDPNAEGLYQNFLNTWISDGHSYNGAGCAQASAYNYAANRYTAAIAKKLGRDSTVFQQRCERILKALNERLWLEEDGLLAESIDRIGNKLVHPSPELSTIYLAIDCECLDPFQSYRLLKFSERQIKNIATPLRQGRLAYSSNWLPKKYSTCGLFPAENACLALAYFQVGQKQKGWELVQGLIDAYYLSHNPGIIRHVLSDSGGVDDGDLDFTDVSSTLLRLLCEGLWGLSFRLLEDELYISPQLPESWKQAELKLPDLQLHWNCDKFEDKLCLRSQHEALKIIRIPLRWAEIEDVWLNKESCQFHIEPGIGCAFMRLETRLKGDLEIRVFYGNTPLPELKQEELHSYAGNLVALECDSGRILELKSPFQEKAGAASERCRLLRLSGKPGWHEVFALVEHCQAKLWLPLAVRLEAIGKSLPAPAYTQQQHICLEECFNSSLSTLHQQEYRSPRPESYSIGMRLNGRYAWDWNQCGHNAVQVDDSSLRQATDGVYKLASGLSFLTPAQGDNLACVSIWDNFPTSMRIPLQGQARAVAVFFICTTNAMQTAVENARLALYYADGLCEKRSLVYPQNCDDWLTAALQKQNEHFYFSEWNHGIVQIIPCDEKRPLAALYVEAVANEVILGVLGVTLLQ
ncbi:MAG: hypothetical protein GX946_05395 [Oligosphaeraceae bacterium]|nr:hypothetical protein [Oligosphaeraceae bacterium]